MTITEFLEECKKLPPKLKCQARQWVNSDLYLRCPINAVIKNITGRNVGNAFRDFDIRGILRRRDADSIVEAADNKNSKKPLRKRLIKALK